MAAKPRATLRADGSALVVLPTGEVAEIAPQDRGQGRCLRDEWRWTIRDTDDARALERADRNAYTKELKRLLVKSTGHKGFSVRGDTGTAYSWIQVRGTDERARMWLAAIFGSPDESIPPTRGYRAWCAARAAGLDGSEIERGEHAWD